MSTPLYEYGPPVTVGMSAEDEGSPQDNSDAVAIDVPGDSPHDPPPDAALIEEPGGSPTEESGAAVEVEPQDEPEEPEEDE